MLSRTGDGIKLYVLLGVLSLVLLGFAQTRPAYYGDEEISLLHAQFISMGKRPYLDFFCPYTPLYFYCLAAWMRVFGQTWRSAHTLSALLAGGTMVLASRYVYAVLQERDSRWIAAALTACLLALNPLFLRFGSIAQYYSFCMFFGLVAFRLSPWALRGSSARSFLVGLAAGTTTAGSQLTAPLGPLLVTWTVVNAEPGDRLTRVSWFLLGGAGPFLPVALPAVQAPRHLFFQIVEYRFRFRAEGSWKHINMLWWNARILTSWLDSTHALLIGFLCIAGWRLCVKTGIDETRLRHLRLCGWLGVAFAVFLSLPRPTFPQYFLLVLPFAAILAGVGFQQILQAVRPANRKRALFLCLGLYALATARYAYQQRWWFDSASHNWPAIDAVSTLVNDVSPSDALIYSEADGIYFTTRRVPVVGYESHWNHVALSPAAVSFAPLAPQELIDRSLTSGVFQTVVFYATSDKLGELAIADRYDRSVRIGDFVIFWSPRLESST